MCMCERWRKVRTRRLCAKRVSTCSTHCKCFYTFRLNVTKLWMTLIILNVSTLVWIEGIYQGLDFDNIYLLMKSLAKINFHRFVFFICSQVHLIIIGKAFLFAFWYGASIRGPRTTNKGSDMKYVGLSVTWLLPMFVVCSRNV